MEGVLPIASNVLSWLLRVGLQASVLVVLVLLAQRLLRNRVSPAWRHALWLLVAARLALPFSLESQVNIFSWINRYAPDLAHQPQRPTAPVIITAPALQIVAGNTAGTATKDAGQLSSSSARAKATLVLVDPSAEDVAHGTNAAQRNLWLHWLGFLWLAGTLILIGRVMLESIRLQRNIAPKRLVTDSAVLELLEDCKQLMGVRVPVVLVQTDLVPSPVLYGFLRPRLLLPTGILQNFSRDELRFVFLHELAHVRRHDIALSWLATFLQVLHWFNPFVWIAFGRMRADRELACDAMVLSHTTEMEYKAYGHTMLKLLEGFTRTVRFPAMAGILEDPSELAARIRGIASFKRRTFTPAFAWAAVALLALVSFTNGRPRTVSSTLPVWPARLLTRSSGDTEIRSITVRPEAGIDLADALSREELYLAADADTTNLMQKGLRVIGTVDGLGLDQWRRGPTIAPYPRTAHTVVWTGRELITWGGGVQNRFLRDGARYDPVADKWRRISTNCPLAGRWNHAAVWTGKEMIVWGGRAHFSSKYNYDDGAIYNLEKDTWRPMSTDGAPAARSQVSYTWTGREFIVWGGRGDNDCSFNDGAKYDPETDTWKRMADCPELESRHNTPVVWTGSEMLIWGGSSWNGSNSFSFDNGASYDPAEDSWKMLPKQGAPTSRTKHTAIWTGTEMIVWGGVHYSSGEYYNTGASFNPTLNRWKPLPVSEVISHRSAHLAAWTGTEMIIWAGMVTNNVCFNNGARFNPATERWSPLTVANAPAPRMLMRPDAAVWTGTEMLVFGGYDFHAEFNSTHAWSPAPAMHLFQRVRDSRH
jgi:beta-lactamase regulating signal transducer with metallopeptidase domain/N-acetylneuraminic acid mutarotase